MINRKSNIKPLILFSILTLLMTYPTVLKMGSSVRDYGDPLLNTWIMSWNAQKIIHLDIADYFDANIFYPHKRTLAYSEHLFPQSLVFLPVYLISKNPIFAYNFVLLLAFLTSGFGMFLLARELTRSFLGGIVAGIIYAFSPFMFSHLGHLQIISAGGIPLTFLFLHKFFKQEKVKHLLLFTFFFLLQVLANGYYALYLALFTGIYILLYIITQKRFMDWTFWVKMAVFAVLVMAMAGPFFRQYILFRQETGFTRGINFYAGLRSFLTVPVVNKIYGPILSPHMKMEGALFPGICVLVLAVFGVVASLRKKEKGGPLVEKYVFIYSVILILSFLFTFGPNGPYILLYKYIPGFDGLRVASRFHVLVMFSLAILSAFGIRALLGSIWARKKVVFTSVTLIGLLLLEYLSAPVPMEKVSVKEGIPGVYKWLSREKKDFAILELPLSGPTERTSEEEFLRPYYSTYHWKKLVNGRSGYFPPLYRELKRRWHVQPLKQNLQDLKKLDVKYIIVHAASYKKDDLATLLAGLDSSSEDSRLKTKVGNVYVYELLDRNGEKSIEVPTGQLRALSKTGWIVHSNARKRQTKYAFDGDLSTSWRIGPQKTDVFFEIDLGRIELVKSISLKLGKKLSDYPGYPRSYRLDVSLDRISWMTVAEEESYILPLTAFLRAKDISFDVIFSQSEARYIKIVNTEKPRRYRWVICEIDVLE